jgi:protein-tyrosine phosphatase
MDITWVTERIGCGGGIWTEEKMIALVKQGVTHIVNMQIEWDDRPLAELYDVEVKWCGTDDDFMPKPRALFDKGVAFAQEALRKPSTKVFIHCAAGVHRAPMMTLALLLDRGWDLEDAMRLIQEERPVVDWAPIYVNSVEEWFEAKKVGMRQ